MSFEFHPEAEDEFNNAIDYYEDIEAGLGYDFALASLFNNSEVNQISKSVGYTRRGSQEIIGKTLSLRGSVLRKAKWNIHSGSYGSSPQSSLLKQKKMKGRTNFGICHFQGK